MTAIGAEDRTFDSILRGKTSQEKAFLTSSDSPEVSHTRQGALDSPGGVRCSCVRSSRRQQRHFSITARDTLLHRG